MLLHGKYVYTDDLIFIIDSLCVGGMNHELYTNLLWPRNFTSTVTHTL